MTVKPVFSEIRIDNNIKIVYEDELFDESIAQNQRKGFISFIQRCKKTNKLDDYIRLLDSICKAKNYNTLISKTLFLYYVSEISRDINAMELEDKASYAKFPQQLSAITQQYFDTHNFSSKEKNIENHINNSILIQHIINKTISIRESLLDNEQKIKIMKEIYHATIKKNPTVYYLLQIEGVMAGAYSCLDINCAEKHSKIFLDILNVEKCEKIGLGTLVAMQDFFRFFYLEKVSQLEIGHPKAVDEIRQTNQNIKRFSNLILKLYEKNKIVTVLTPKNQAYCKKIVHGFGKLVNSRILTVEHLIDPNALDIKKYFQNLSPLNSNVLNLTNNMVVSLRNIPHHIRSKLEDNNLVDLNTLDYAEELSALTFAIETKLRVIYTIYTKEFIPSLIRQCDKRKNSPYTKEFLLDYQKQLEGGAFKDGETTITIGSFYNKITGQDRAIKIDKLKKNTDLFSKFAIDSYAGDEFKVARLLGDIVLYHKYRNDSSHSSINTVKYNLDVPRVSKKSFEEAITIGLFAPNSILNIISDVFGDRIKQWQEKNRQKLLESEQEDSNVSRLRA